MMRRKLFTAIALAGALQAGLVHAVGLGQVELHSALNQPLDAEIGLISVGDLDESQIFVKLASKEDFDRAGVDREYFLTKLRFDVEIDKHGKSVVKVRTTDLVREPYLNFVVEARWPNGRVLREYTVLLDLPVTQGAAANIKPATLAANAPKLSATAAATLPARPVARPAAAAPAAAPAGEETAAPSAATAPAPSARPASGRVFQPVAGGYRIQPGETLWAIAKKLRPGSDVSVNQTMLAIQSMNPDAFYGDNINRIKAGVVLRLPDEASARAVTQAQAAAEVAAQNQAWREGVSRPLPTRTSAPSQAAAPAPKATEGEGRLELSASAQPAATGTAPATPAEAAPAPAPQAAPAATDGVHEDLAAAERQNAELKENLDKTQEQVETMKRLQELKDQQMAALQSGGAKKEAETAPAAGNMKNLLMYAGAGLLALFAIVAVLLQRRKSAAAEPAPRVNKPVLVARTGSHRVVTAADTRAAQAPTEEIQAATTAVHEAVESAESVQAAAAREAVETAAPTEAQTGDVLGEAGIYMSLGRHAQAASMLKGALAKDPDNANLNLKLLEVYVDSDNPSAFRKHFESMQEKASAQTIGRAKELLLSVDDPAAWLGERRNTLEVPVITQADIDQAQAQEVGEPEAPAPVEAAPAATGSNISNTSEMAVVELDDTGDFDFSTFGAKEAEKAVAADESHLDLGGNDDLDFLADADESGTKLDLARAYIDMGDTDGARDILQEVMQGGDANAKEEAKKLLDQL